MTEQKNKLNRGQKLAAAGLAVFGIFVIIMWAVSFKNNLYGPFQYQSVTQAGLAGEQAGICPSGNCEQDRQKELLSEDTDKDGISDWEELNIYKTSPYLEDSDSDGYNDWEEIKTGFDPNCPRGKDCNVSNVLLKDIEEPLEDDFLNQSDIEILNSLLEQEGMVGNLEINSQQAEQTEGLEEVLAGQSNALELRNLLLEAGMDKELLDQISDEVLMDSYQETLNTN